MLLSLKWDFSQIFRTRHPTSVDLVLKHIPKEFFDKRAVDRGEAKFHDVAYIDVRAHIDENNVAIELTDYSVFYTGHYITD